MQTVKRCDFIDWLKAVGMFLIVFGHYFGEPFDQLTQPIYPKQLGVAFFVFVMGWGLAKENRTSLYVVTNRLFPMYFWGVNIALFITLIYYLSLGKFAISNYLPFLGGANVILNFFPANPTTWFIGTYLHLLLLWAIVRNKVNVNLQLILVLLVFEWLVRALFIGSDRLFTGYMLTSNWLTVFFLGMLMTQRKDEHAISKGIGLIACWLAFLVIWAFLLNPLEFNNEFPFRRIDQWSNLQNAMVVSAFISIVYVANTLFAVSLFSKIPANRVVRFFSRNTIIIFIGHMPLYDVAEPAARLIVEQGWGKRAIIVLIMYVGLACVSEVLHKLINIAAIRDKLLTRVLQSQSIYTSTTAPSNKN